MANLWGSDMIDLSVLSDLYKDAHGFRPSSDWCKTVADMDEFSQNDVWNSLVDQIEENEILRKYDQDCALASWEKHITGLMSEFSISKADAIRWDMQALVLTEMERDAAEYAYHWGLDSKAELEIYALLRASVEK